MARPAAPIGLEFALAASVPALAAAQERVAAFLRDVGVAPRLVGRVELMIEELVLNVIAHGRLANPGTESLHLAVTLEQGPRIRLRLEDPGLAFDPTAVAPPAPSPGTLEEARVGGLGLVLLHRMACDLAYVRLPEGRNRITLVLRDGAAPPG